ncbi:TonB-dependent receptor plug domain-containing protein [Hyphomicrobium nitrativorans]|nr:TonB-dependent receptor [Hyphomicrobium nitrativorans]
MKGLAFGLMLSAAVVASSPARAQDGAVWLDGITVIGTRTEVSVQDNPASVTVIDQQQLERRAPESIAEMLRDVPGVEVVDSSAAGMKRLRIRGESSARVTILVDGQEMTDHSTFGTPILIDPSNVERIDVVRGPASVLYGAKAIGGVINIITKRGSEKPVELELGGAYYSGTKGKQGWAALSGTINSLDYRISGTLADHEDRKVPSGRYTSTGRLDGTSFDSDDLYLHLGHTFGAANNHYLALKVEQNRLTTENWTDPESLVFPITDFRIDLPQRDRQKIGVYYDGKNLGPVLRNVHVDAFYQTIDRLFMNEVVMRPTPAAPNRSVTVTSTSDDQIVNFGGTIQADFQFHPDHETIVGAHYLSDGLDTAKTSSTISRGFPFPVPPTLGDDRDKAFIRTASAFAQNTWSFAQDFKLATGIRYHHIETELDETTSATRTPQSNSEGQVVTSASLVYTGIQDTTLRAHYAEGYITPTLLQLFTDTAAGRGTNTYGNPNLDTETSRSYEIGARYNADGLALDLAGFYTTAKDYITTVRCGTGPACPAGALAAEYIYDNVDAATTFGIELMAEYAVPGTAFTPYVSGAWTRRKLEFQRFDTYNSNTPELSGRIGVRYDTVISGFNLWTDLFVRTASGVKLSSWNETASAVDTDTLSGWTTLNFAFGGPLTADESATFAVHLNNLTDEEYRSSFDELPGIGRSVEVSARVKF